ncbi:MAG: class I SAM-dependent methyltransferase [Rhodanobacteraceae bacterium]
MKIRDSGMPDATTWEGFFEPRRVLAQLAFNDGQSDVAEFGCGYGTFTVAAAALTTGTVHAFDIDPVMVDAVAQRAATGGLANINAALRDFVADGTGLPDASVDYAMLFNILHADDPLGLLHEAHRILRPGGTVAVIHWIHDAATPRGPDLAIRPRPEQCAAWLRRAGFDVAVPMIPLPPWHYGLVGVKRAVARPGTPR